MTNDKMKSALDDTKQIKKPDTKSVKSDSKPKPKKKNKEKEKTLEVDGIKAQEFYEKYRALPISKRFDEDIYGWLYTFNPKDIKD